jgi:hypothetical protein
MHVSDGVNLTGQDGMAPACCKTSDVDVFEEARIAYCVRCTEE